MRCVIQNTDVTDPRADETVFCVLGPKRDAKKAAQDWINTEVLKLLETP